MKTDYKNADNRAKKFVKNSLFITLEAAGINELFHRQNQDKAVVLTYHGVVPELAENISINKYRNFVTTAQFAQQIKFLLDHFTPLKVKDFYTSHAKIEGGFLITFDDGFRNNYQYAMPILKKNGLQGCFFITTKLIGTREYLWTDHVVLLLEKTKKTRVELNLGTHTLLYELDTPYKKEKASIDIRRQMKSMPLYVMKKTFDQFKTQLDDVPLTIGKTDEDRYLLMNWDEVREMIDSGQSIGAHSHNHSVMARLSEEESMHELSCCKTIIEEKIGRPCHSFSYPNGEKNDYTDTTIRHLKATGFKCAFTQIPLFNDRSTDPYQLHRINIDLKMSLPVFKAKVCGVIL